VTIKLKLKDLFDLGHLFFAFLQAIHGLAHAAGVAVDGSRRMHSMTGRKAPWGPEDSICWGARCAHRGATRVFTLAQILKVGILWRLSATVAASRRNEDVGEHVLGPLINLLRRDEVGSTLNSFVDGGDPGGLAEVDHLDRADPLSACTLRMLLGLSRSERSHV